MSLHCLLDYLTPACFGTVLLVFSLIALIKLYFKGGVFKANKDLDLTGKTAVVTGGNSGIGAETVVYLTKKGCSVLIGARDASTAEAVIKRCRSENPSCKVDFLPLDLSSRASIESFAKGVTFSNVNFLINNAGLMAIPRRKLTKEGLEMQWGVNHIGHFYLTYLLWSKIKITPNFRVVNVSSLAHKRNMGFLGQPTLDFENINYETNYSDIEAYGRSKLYNVLFTRALASKIDPSQGKVLSLHPGVVRTELMREITSEGIGKLVAVVMVLIHPIYWLFTKNPW
jgi:retinol dehydrogenase 12